MTEKTTIKVIHDVEGNTIVKNGDVEWNFGYKMLDETIIASLVFQTIFTKFEELKTYSSEFSIEFTMEVANDWE